MASDEDVLALRSLFQQLGKVLFQLLNCDLFHKIKVPYLDVYLCILLGASGHQEVEKELSGSQDCLQRLETDIELFQLCDLTLDLCRGRVVPLVSTPRSLDLAHLRTALWFHQRESLTRFVTLDGQQSEAAREMGLPV